MKFSRSRFRFQPELISLEDRCVPAVTALVPAASLNGVAGTGVVGDPYVIPENTTGAIQLNPTLNGGTTSVLFNLNGGAGNLDSQFFTIVANTGVITFVAAPNFEAPTDIDGVAGNNNYAPNVTATANNGTAGAVTTDVFIRVADVVELVGGGGAPVAVNAAENQIAQILFDADPLATEAAGTTFALSGPDAARFAINAAGQLTFINGPFAPELAGQVGRDFERPSDANADGVYSVTITGNRAGALSGAGFASSQITVNVTVTDVAENSFLNNAPTGQFNPIVSNPAPGLPFFNFPPAGLQTTLPGGTGGFFGAVVSVIPAIPGSALATGGFVQLANFFPVNVGGGFGQGIVIPFLFI